MAAPDDDPVVEHVNPCTPRVGNDLIFRHVPTFDIVRLVYGPELNALLFSISSAMFAMFVKATSFTHDFSCENPFLIPAVTPAMLLPFTPKCSICTDGQSANASGQIVFVPMSIISPEKPEPA